MKSLHDIYSTVRNAGPHCSCDKGDLHSYIDVYDDIFAPYRTKPGVSVLEIGVHNGGSLRMWQEYFKSSRVEGIDLPGSTAILPFMQEGSCQVSLLNAIEQDKVNAAFNGKSFDVIIEDAGHMPEDQLVIYHNFKKFLNPGGIYVIEDIQDIATWRARFERINALKQVTILDRRGVKGRYDDVLVVIQDKV